MQKFKQLEWKPQEYLKGFYSEPAGLQWRYSIIEHVSGKIEFALLDAYYEYAPSFPKICKSIAEAQEMAKEHYSTVLEQHLAS